MHQPPKPHDLARQVLTVLAGLILPYQTIAAEKLPADVAVFVDRSDTCMHWAGEEAYDKARQRQIEAAFAKNRCDTLEKDGKQLQKQYAQNPAALKAIRKTLANWQ